MCLKTDPDERPNIDQVIQSPWISVRVKNGTDFENLFSFESLKEKVRVRAFYYTESVKALLIIFFSYFFLRQNMAPGLHQATIVSLLNFASR